MKIDTTTVAIQIRIVIAVVTLLTKDACLV